MLTEMIRMNLKRQLVRKMRDECEFIRKAVEIDLVSMWIFLQHGLYNLYEPSLQDLVDRVGTTWGKLVYNLPREVSYYNLKSNKYPVTLGATSPEETLMLGLFYLSMAVNKKLEMVYTKAILKELKNNNKLAALAKARQQMWQISRSLSQGRYREDRIFTYLSPGHWGELKAKQINHIQDLD
jgi:hypothetical protein